MGERAMPLYAWTVADPAKEAKYTKSFTLYVGGDEVCERSKADALEAELKPLVGGPIAMSAVAAALLESSHSGPLRAAAISALQHSLDSINESYFLVDRSG